MLVWLTPLEKIIIKNNFRIDGCIMYLLAWLEQYSPEPELLKVVAFSKKYKYSNDIQEIITEARHLRLSDLQLCLEIVRDLGGAEREIVMQIICAYLQTAGDLNDDRSYIVKFLADTLKISAAQFKLYLNEISRIKVHGGTTITCEDFVPRRGNYLWQGKTLNAYSVLNIDPSATAQETKQAYKRAAQEQHPDRFAPKGPVATAAALEKFKMVQAAYKHLVPNE